MKESIDLSSCKVFCTLIAEMRKQSLLKGRQKLKPHLWCGPEGLLVAHGREFTPARGLPNGYKMGPMGQCYANAGRLAASLDDVFYCEGYAVKSGTIPLPLAHGWCCDRAGRVIDPTWDDGVEYFGAVFKRRYLLNRTLETGIWGLLFEDWNNNWRTLRTPAKVWKQEVG